MNISALVINPVDKAYKTVTMERSEFINGYTAMMIYCQHNLIKMSETELLRKGSVLNKHYAKTAGNISFYVKTLIEIPAYEPSWMLNN